MGVFFPPKPCCVECPECDVPMYKYSNYIDYSKTIVGNEPSPSSIVVYDRNTYELHRDGSLANGVTTLTPPTFYGEPVDLISIRIDWQKNIPPSNFNDSNAYIYYSLSGTPTTDFRGISPELNWPGLCRFDGNYRSDPSGFYLRKNALKLISDTGPGNRVIEYLSDSTYYYSNQGYTNQPELAEAVLEYESAYLIININEDLNITEPPGTNLFGASPTNQTTKLFVTVVCSGEPYTMKFECAPNLSAITGGPIVTRRNGFGAKSESMIFYSGAKIPSTAGLGYLFYPPIHADYPTSGTYPRGGYQFDRSRWIMTSAYKGTRNNFIEEVSALPNNIPLVNGAVCVSVSNYRVGYNSA